MHDADDLQIEVARALGDVGEQSMLFARLLVQNACLKGEGKRILTEALMSETFIKEYTREAILRAMRTAKWLDEGDDGAGCPARRPPRTPLSGRDVKEGPSPLAPPPDPGGIRDD